ncbi:MAG: phosphatase PAP2 family protein [Sphaerochaetaceae bacterium]
MVITTNHFFQVTRALAFASAAFTQTVFSQKYKESKWKLPVTITTWSLAATTAILRVASGSHYLSDVVVGSLVGSLFGFTIPFIANKISPTWQLGVGPNAVAFNVTY